MSQTPPNIPDDEPAKFAFAVGRVLQNFGTIEYLVNQILEKTIQDPLILSHIIRMPIAKRLEVLSGLVSRDQTVIEGAGISPSKLITSAKSAFKNRNQVAHNPLVVMKAKSDGESCLTIGIHVIRYAEKGSSEEWIDHAKLETFIIESHTLLPQFNWLLGHYSEKN
jgi:hypothetical protein